MSSSSPTRAFAQGMRFFYPAPSPSSFTVVRNVKYGMGDTTTLRMDVYRPAKAGAPRPAFIIFSPVPPNQRSSNEFTSAWGRVAASKGLVAIIPDVRPESAAADIDAL